MKVAILLENFYIGGAQRVVCELVKNFDHSKAELLVICTGRRSETQMARDVERLVRVEYLNITGHTTLKDFQKVFRVLDAFKPDVVNAHLVGQLYAVPWGILHRKPTIITVHTKPEQGFVKRIMFLIRWALKYGRLSLVAVSQENLRLLREFFKVDDERICCINNGIDINAFYRVKHEHFTFINVARHDENKNQMAILRCFAKLYQSNNQLRLILLGNGPAHQKLRETAEELGVEDAVEFPGLVNNVADYYARADVYVQASRREAMPMSVLEAMAAGLPIIATDVGGLRDVIRDNGYLYEAADDECLLKLMIHMTQASSVDMAKIEAESNRIAKEYTSGKMAREYWSCFLREAKRI